MFVNSRIIRVAKLVSLAAVLAFALCVSASAVQVGDTVDTSLTGDLGTLRLIATVDLTAGVYTYTYNLEFQQAGFSNEVHYFGIGNPENEFYQNATNTNSFFDPQWFEGDLALEWADGVLGVGNSATFTYQSTAAPNWEVLVNAYSANLASVATGYTVGMQSSVPEPSALAGLAMAFAGIAPFIRRRR